MGMRKIQTETNQDFKEKQKILSGLVGEMAYPISKKPNKKKEHLTRNKIGNKKKAHKIFKESNMRELIRESKEFTYYNPYARKISFSKRKKIDIKNIIFEFYLNTGKKNKNTIGDIAKQKLESVKPIFGNLDSAISSLVDFFVYIQYCMVMGNDTK